MGFFRNGAGGDYGKSDDDTLTMVEGGGGGGEGGAVLGPMRGAMTDSGSSAAALGRGGSASPAPVLVDYYGDNVDSSGLW
ncbi:Os10g0184225 [Oryza sativa Japonica Group]|uniref:Os10g0184225 protein n=1 Tax=Oryza sativa subsp. japonica TaxID=39947 RepID=A0A0P0XSN3_ORYSJ|nr:Os10g0184225 [Oryza sativa Japonica Group]